jgi:dihydrolipoamide dehydrogenase
MNPLGLVFSDPQVALVGPRVPDLAAIDHVTGTAEFARNGRARVLDHTRGMVRVYADAGDGRLLGGAIVGPGAEHIGHLQASLRDARARLRPASS